MKLTRYRVLLIIAFVLCWSISSDGQQCPTTPLNKQARGAMKHIL